MDQFKRLTGMLSVQQRWAILIVGILAAAGVYYGSRWQTESNFRPLYTSLAPEDAGLVVQKLKEGGTPFRLTNNGTIVLAPEEKVAELRLELAGAGIPKSGRIGFEIFDKTNFGMTDFAEHVNYRRALEGELERSVMSVSEVEQARVHISLPQDSVFLESRQPAKASILVKIRSGAALPDSAVPAITHLVASAVEGLSPDDVSLLDMRGNLLNRPRRKSGGGDDSSEVALEYRQKIEQDLTAKLETTLEPIVGAGRFRTSVSAECDLTSGDQSEETFDPTHSVMTTSQKTEDVTTQSRAATGVPGTVSNLPDPAPPPPTPGGGVSRKTENVNYQTSRTVKHTVLPQGAVKRLSVSVLLDQEVHWEGTGATAKRLLVPPTPERLKVIQELVTAAVGFNTERGDQLIVESLPFESTLNMDPPAAVAPVAAAPKKPTPLEQLKSDPKLIGGLAGIVIVVFGGGFFFIRKLTKKATPQVQVRAQQALPKPNEHTDGAEPNRMAPANSSASAVNAPSLPALMPGKVDLLTTQIRTAAQENAELCAGVLRGWIRSEGMRG